MTTTLTAAALTAENIRDIIEEGHILTPAGYPVGGSVPCDIRDEMRRAPEDFVGAELWQFPCGAEQGTAVRCTSGRGAMHWGADSTWGDWSGDVFQADDADLQRFDANGDKITDESDEEPAESPRVAAVDMVSRDPFPVTDDTPVAVRLIHRPDSETDHGPFDGRNALGETGRGSAALAEALIDAEERANARVPVRAFVFAFDGETWWEVDLARTDAERAACARATASAAA